MGKFTKTLLTVIFLTVSTFQLQAGSRYLAPIIIENHIEITVEVIEVFKTCFPTYYHYGTIQNVYSRSLTNQPYNINFNGYIYSTLGFNPHSHFGVVNITNTNPNHTNVSTHGTGKEVAVPNPIQCADVTLDNIGLTHVEVVYWGTHSGSWLNGGHLFGNFASTLPVELMEFNAKPNNENVEIFWTTATEKNNDFFTIERSVDGVNFEEIGKVNGNGNSSKIINYKLTDLEPIKGVSYYRLKQTDFDGGFEYFDLISVNFKKNKVLSSIYPNPAISNKTKVFLEKSNNLVTINVRNVFGQIISSKNIDTKNNAVAEEVELLGSGIFYFIEVIENNESTIYKVFNQ